jgi:hypothetical protein
MNLEALRASTTRKVTVMYHKVYNDASRRWDAKQTVCVAVLLVRAMPNLHVVLA